MPAPDHVVTVINGVNVVNGIGSVATGYKTPDGGVDYTNTVIGIGGTAASAAQIAGGLGHTVPSWAGPVGAAAGVAGTVQNIQNINNATASGQNVQASDAFGVVAGLTGLGAGAVGVLLGTGAAIFWPLTLVSTLAGGIAWVASGNGWEFDPITGQTIPMTQDELQRNKEIFDDIQASIDELNDRTISTLLDPTATYIPRTPRYFDPICRRSSYSSSPKSTYRIVYTDPLAIDMDHDGLETANLQKAILFDHDGDGIKTGTGWLKGDDAWLVRDLNGNGTIDTGAEMFGDQTVLANGNKATSGLQALAALDSNGDGQINASDATFSQLKIWQDLNQDGVSQTNELKTLSEAGLTQIALTSSSTAPATTVNVEGGKYTTQSVVTVTRADGSTTTAADLSVTSDTFYSQYTERIAIPDDLKDLPDIPGMGRLRSLKEAAATSPALATVYKQYCAAQSPIDNRNRLRYNKRVFTFIISHGHLCKVHKKLSNN